MKPIRWKSRLFIIASLLVVAGCGRGHRDANNDQVPVEPTWAQALEEVRRGNSVEIRRLHDPVSDKQLDEIVGFDNLGRLNFPKSQITDAGLAKLADSLPQLELLRLGSPNVTDAGLESIAKLKNLRFLHLIEVPLTDAGLVHLEKMTWLESFYLDGGQATEDGLSALLKALPKLHFHRDQQHLPGDPHGHKHPHKH